MTNEEFQNIMIQQFNKVFEKLDTMETRLTSLEKGQLRLETRMENEIVEKIRGLSDGFEFRGDQIENLKKHIDERLDSIEIDTGYLVSRVARLEKIAK
ncbi:MAG: hypothetical protein AB1341_15145 [Bacillota bacterium]